ncbi:hypothetical protein FPE01S_03_05290 [Flavihumibacter petaseus NBRC 106054]|uniref:TonB-dependent receptor n=2 Tax=Flavihumibacter TaxID=1004301 RepID=A0A0E9N3E8_9BACT|nr:hypothetical protein FPE01S_03_05290 [Flavihumibacter petaseus NBRC 106054]
MLHAGTISGWVKDEKGNPVSYASIYVKQGREGTTSGGNGQFQLTLASGTYVLIAHHVGYAKVEKTIIVGDEPVSVNFTLVLQQVVLSEVVVKPGAEDPAYEIIRNAIRLRKQHLEELSHFSSEVYTREQLQLRDYPKKFMGQPVDFEDGDTSKRKMLYLSETVARYAVKPPGKARVDVLSTRVSGSRNAFGLSLPKIISFYENVIAAEALNPRGFISPISENALHYYRYQYEGSFREDSVEVNRIKVIPKRKYEPLFSGYIMITENSWRIHSLQLELLKSSQMEILDTLKIEQLYAPYSRDVWVIRNQVLYPSIRIFGFDAFGSAVTMYSKFDLDAGFAPKYFNNTLMKYHEGSNRKSDQYWDSIRPLPLQPEEILDFRRKDSLEQQRMRPEYLDSVDRIRNKLSVMGLLFTGESISRQKRRTTWVINGLIPTISFNTVEGWVVNPSVTWIKQLDTLEGRKQLAVTGNARYGFSSQHFYGRLNASYSFGKGYGSTLTAAAGKYVFQFNNANPIGSLVNSLSSLIWESNYMKLYEAAWFQAGYSKGIGNGMTVFTSFQFQDRSPLENTTGFSWRNVKDKNYTPNYPAPASESPMPAHQASVLTAGLTWKPGEKYIEFPDRKISLGSKYPQFSAALSKGINKFLGSDIDYLKWGVSVTGDANMKLAGTFSYHLSAGGFINRDAVQTPDYRHFNGNQTVLATSYLSGFQALPYYQYSSTPGFWSEMHAEHHFNGMLTNKIPGFRKLNWYLVAGGHILVMDGGSHYGELSAGLENIFKIIRTDIVWSFDQNSFRGAYFRFSIKGLAGGN